MQSKFLFLPLLQKTTYLLILSILSLCSSFTVKQPNSCTIPRLSLGGKTEQNALYLSLPTNIAIFHDSVHLSHDIFRIGYQT